MRDPRALLPTRKLTRGMAHGRGRGFWPFFLEAANTFAVGFAKCDEQSAVYAGLGFAY